MSQALYDVARDGFLTGLFAWTTDTFKAALLDLTLASTGVRIVTNATNASPVVYTTSVVHGFLVGDTVVVGGVGGNLSANQIGVVATVPTTSTFTMRTLFFETGNVVGGSAAYTSGGYAVNLSGLATFLSDISASRATASTDATLSGETSSLGVANANSPIAFTSVPVGNPIGAMVLYKSTGVAGTSRLVAYYDGKTQVVMDATAALAATTLVVEPLKAAIPTGTVLSFSNGSSATMSALANRGDRSITVGVLAAAVAVGSTAEATATSAGLPFTPNGNNVNCAIDSDAAFRLFRL